MRLRNQIQRDLYSAFLAKHIEPETFVLQVSQLLSDWQSEQLRLWATWRAATENQPATGGIRPFSFGRCPSGRAGRRRSLHENT